MIILPSTKKRNKNKEETIFFYNMFDSAGSEIKYFTESSLYGKRQKMTTGPDPDMIRYTMDVATNTSRSRSISLIRSTVLI